MPTPTIAIRTAGPRDHDHIASLLTASFVTSPVARWLMPDPDSRPHLARLLFDGIVQQAIEQPHATVDLTDDGYAAAVWYDHTDDYRSSPGVGVGAGLLPIAELIGAPIGPQVQQMQDALAHVTAVEAHYRLAYLGVDEPDRERGLARALLEHHHRQWPGTAVHAVAQNPTDLGLLGVAGYLACRPITLPGRLTLWPARRPPLPPPAAG